MEPLGLRNILQEPMLEIRVKPGRDPFLESFRTRVQDKVHRLYQFDEVRK